MNSNNTNYNFREGDFFTQSKRYRLEEVIGIGGFAEVWKALDTYTNQYIAIKIFSKLNEEDLGNLAKEYSQMKDLNHPNILKAEHFDLWDGIPYLIMQYCAGSSLDRNLGKLSEADLMAMVMDVSMGLDFLHNRHLVHQDIKPANILTAYNEDGTCVFKLSDFGISKNTWVNLNNRLSGRAQQTSMTPAYAPPEKFSQNPEDRVADAKGDIFSFGLTLYEIITGTLPYGEISTGNQMQNYPEVTIDLSPIPYPRMRWIIDWCTKRDMNLRPSASQIRYMVLSDEIPEIYLQNYADEYPQDNEDYPRSNEDYLQNQEEYLQQEEQNEEEEFNQEEMEIIPDEDFMEDNEYSDADQVTGNPLEEETVIANSSAINETEDDVPAENSVETPEDISQNQSSAQEEPIQETEISSSETQIPEPQPKKKRKARKFDLNKAEDADSSETVVVPAPEQKRKTRNFNLEKDEECATEEETVKTSVLPENKDRQEETSTQDSSEANAPHETEEYPVAGNELAEIASVSEKVTGNTNLKASKSKKGKKSNKAPKVQEQQETQQKSKEADEVQEEASDSSTIISEDYEPEEETATIVNVPAKEETQPIQQPSRKKNLMFAIAGGIVGVAAITGIALWLSKSNGPEEASPETITAYKPVTDTVMVNDIPLVMVKVPSGTMTLGYDIAQDPKLDNKKENVAAFTIGQTEVTQKLWQSIMGTNPSTVKGDDLPVNNISWEDAQSFITKLNATTGKTFTLPTELQWEYAAKMQPGNPNALYAGTSQDPATLGWLKSNSANTIHPVAQKEASVLGIYDMAGNVIEWCEDVYTDTNGNSPDNNASHVLRGGYYDSEPNAVRTTAKASYDKAKKSPAFGLRVVLK